MAIDFDYRGKKYDCILADPPWSYNNKNTGGSMLSGASSQYSTMSTKEIMSIPVWKISEKDSVLFLWAVNPMLPEAFAVMKNWGYEYKTAIYWHKIGKFGMGFWIRVDMEVCLVGIKGDVKPFGLQVSNVIEEKPREHSRKPDAFYEIVESIGFKNKFEMFARERREGYDTFGNETSKTTQRLLIRD